MGNISHPPRKAQRQQFKSGHPPHQKIRSDCTLFLSHLKQTSKIVSLSESHSCQSQSEVEKSLKFCSLFLLQLKKQNVFSSAVKASSWRQQLPLFLHGCPSGYFLHIVLFSCIITIKPTISAGCVISIKQSTFATICCLFTRCQGGKGITVTEEEGKGNLHALT